MEQRHYRLRGVVGEVSGDGVEGDEEVLAGEGVLEVTEAVDEQLGGLVLEHELDNSDNTAPQGALCFKYDIISLKHQIIKESMVNKLQISLITQINLLNQGTHSQIITIKLTPLINNNPIPTLHLQLRQQIKPWQQNSRTITKITRQQTNFIFILIQFK